MNKLLYVYDKDNVKIHNNFIKNSTIKKEAYGANKVSIYSCKDYEIELYQLFDKFSNKQYITTLLLN